MIPDTLFHALAPYADGVRIGSLRKQHAKQAERRRILAKCDELRIEVMERDVARLVEIEMGGQD